MPDVRFDWVDPIVCRVAFRRHVEALLDLMDRDQWDASVTLAQFDCLPRHDEVWPLYRHRPVTCSAE